MATERFDVIITSRGATETARQIKRIGVEAAGTRKALAFLRSALVVVASARVIGNLVQQLDLFSELSNRLRLVTNNTRELALVQDALFAVARRTRADFEGTVVVFQRLAQTTRSLGLEYNELLDLTAAVNTAVALSGASAQSSSAGIRQFAQALASGRLAGDELRSVVENLPFLADIIGKEFGVAGAALQSINKANPGIITTARIIKALQENSAGLAKTLGESQLTIGQAFTILGNSVTFFFGKLSATTGAGRALANLLIEIADNIDVLVLALAGFAGVVAINVLIGQLATLNRTLLLVGAASVRVFATMARAILIPLSLLARFFLPVTAIIGLFTVFRKEITEVANRFVNLKEAITIVATAALATLKTIIDAWRKLPSALGDLATQAINFITTIFTLGVNKIIGLLNKIPGIDLEPRELNLLPNKFAGAAESIRDTFLTNYNQIREADPFEFAKGRLEELQSFLKQFSFGGVNEKAIRDLLEGLRPKGSGETNAEQLEQLKGAYKRLLQQISPLAKAFFELKTAEELVAKAQAAGIDIAKQFGLTNEEVLRRVRRNLAGVGNDADIAREKLKLVNDALEANAITLEEATRRQREINIEALEKSVAASAGVERFFLKLQQQSEDVASGIEDLFKTAFQGIEDAIVGFVQTGKLSFADLLKDIEEQLLRSAIKGLIADLGASLFGQGQAANNNLINTIFSTGQGRTGGGGGNFFAQFAGQIGSFLAGAQNGLDFTVGAGTSLASLSGVDNRLVAFRAKDGENVTVTPKGQSTGGTNITFNVTTPDADSFRRSQSQLLADTQVAMNRAARRNI